MNEQHFWYYLLNVSESLDAIQPDPEKAREQLLEYLETVEEVFGKSFDPVDEFEKFSATALCKSIRKFLQASA